METTDTTTPAVESPMTDAELTEWMTARGVCLEDIPSCVAENRGKTRTHMDAEYDRVCGPMA
jgi:hypothetical protein